MIAVLSQFTHLLMRSHLVFLLAVTGIFARELPKEKRILFLGDSITQGGAYVEFIDAALRAQHPDLDIEIIPCGLSSETVSGLSEEGHAGGKFPRPDLHERLERALAKTTPQLVFACYGMNDGIYMPLGAKRTKAYQDGIGKLRAKVAAIGARMVHLTPPVFDPIPIADKVVPADKVDGAHPFKGYNEVLDFYANWLLDRRDAEKWEVLDVHGVMTSALVEKRKVDPQFTFSRDGVHPGVEGHLLMARPILEAWGLQVREDGTPDHPNGAAILAAIQKKHAILRPAWLAYVGHKRPGVAVGLPIEKALKKAADLDAEARRLAKLKDVVFPNPNGEWNGYAKHEMTIAGKPVTVVVPKTAAIGRPWVWHGEFFGHKPAPDIALLGKGFHIIYMKIHDMLGCPDAVQLWNQCHAELTTHYGLSKKPALVGLSRGGLYCYNWAIANPDKVSCIYGDAPVCDFKSWPGGKGKGKGDPRNWGFVLKLWGFKDEAEALAYRGNPVDSLAVLAKAGVPLLHVFGDADDVVPWDENTGLIESRYKELGGSITLIRKPGVGHHPHGLENSMPIVDFIAKHASK